MKPFKISDITIFVPALWDKPWSEYVEGAEGIERDFIAAQAVYADMLRHFSGQPATPEKVAWLALWGRLWGALSGARGAADWDSRFAITVMERVVFETALQIQAIMLPVLDRSERTHDAADEVQWATVMDRLRGYTAWCLIGDANLNKRLRDPRTLDATFDPRPERSMIAVLGESVQAWEQLSGQRLETVSDQEAHHDRARAERTLTTEANRIAQWLTATELSIWVKRIRGLERENQQARKGAVTLFQLFDLPPSIHSFLLRRNIGFSYFNYLKGSGFIHGSTLSASLVTANGFLTPDFADIDGGGKSTAAGLISECRLTAILLATLVTRLDGKT